MYITIPYIKSSYKYHLLEKHYFYLWEVKMVIICNWISHIDLLSITTYAVGLYNNISDVYVIMHT